MATRDLHLHGRSCHFPPGHGVPAASSSRYQRSSWCCTDTSFPLFPKGTGELCWAVPDEIKGKPLTGHFMISCHCWRAAPQLPDEPGLGCLGKAGQGDRDQSRETGQGWAQQLPGVCYREKGVDMKCRLWILAKGIPELNPPCLWKHKLFLSSLWTRPLRETSGSTLLPSRSCLRHR